MEKDRLAWRQTNGLLIISLLFFFILFLVGWYQVPGLFGWGLYTDVDGQFAEWYTHALGTWSHPLSISNINPFEGMGSLFFPNNIWLNPGALALLLPIQRIGTYLFSYGIYLIEVSLSIYALARTLHLSRIQAVIAIQAFAFFLFPPFTAYTHALSFFSGCPLNAHLMALLNICLVLFNQLGKKTSLSNPTKVTLIVLIFWTAFYSGPMTLLTFLPTYGLFGLGLLAQNMANAQDKKTLLLWKLAPLVIILLQGLALDCYAYLAGTAGYVSRTFEINPVHLTVIEYLNGLLLSFEKYSGYNNYPQTSLFAIRKDYPIFLFHGLAVAGGLLACFRAQYRWLALSFLTIALSIDTLLILRDSLLFPKLLLMNPVFFLWSAYSFYALFFLLFFSESWKRLCSQRYLGYFLNPLKGKITGHAQAVIASFTCLIFPLFALYLFFGPFNLANMRAPIPLSVNTPIIQYLEKTIKLKPGSPFNGYAISYLGAPGGGIRPHLDEVTPLQMDFSIYIKSRNYLKLHYGNWHMLSDLWKYSIPTLEEYGQWITIPLYAFVGDILAKPDSALFVSNINVFALDYGVLQALGIRFIITDSVLKDPRVQQTTIMTKEDAAPLYLYEIAHPNLGNYSPTQVKVLDTAKEIMSYFHEGYHFEDTVVVQTRGLPTALSAAYDTALRFGINKITIKAQSHGVSLLLLPFQFSHCYRINPASAAPPIKLMRANLVQTAILFKQNLDTELLFDFGTSRNAGCRKADIQDIAALGLR